MGKPKKKRGQHKKKPSAAGENGTSQPATSKPKFGADQLLDKAEEYIDSFEFDLAQKFCLRALESEPDNLRAIETYGNLLMETGDLDKAKQCFLKSVELQPEGGYSKYMYLGQLFTGLEAVQFFKKGGELMEKAYARQQMEQAAAAAGGATPSGQEDTITAKEISDAFCSIAEIYMTDCCFEENAEEECRSHVEKALITDPSNPEAYQINASFLIVKQDKEGAKEMMKKSVSLWLPQVQAAEKAETAEHDGKEYDPVEVTKISYPARITSAKVLIELEEYDTAFEILERLLDVQDEVVDVWYLLGWMNFLRSEEYKTNARFYLLKAQEVAKKVGCDEEEMLSHIEQLLQELGPGEASDDTQAVDGGEGGSDVGSSSEEEGEAEEAMEH